MAVQNEYTGFIPATNPIDWAKLTGGLVKTIQGIGASREAERQVLDQLQVENAKILQNTELGKSQNFNQLILAGSNDGREAMMEWNKQLKAGLIKPAEYRNKINNLMDSWSTFANVAKTYDQQMQEVLKQQAEGTISSFGVFNNLELANFGDLKNKQGKVDRNSGTYMIGELGQDGLFLPSSVRDPRSLAKPGNIMDNKINLQEAAAEGTKDWASWMKELKAETISGKLANPNVQKVRVQLANTIASNERAMASILSDNVGDYDFYADQNQFIAKLQQRVDLQNEVNKNLNKPALSGDELDKFKKQEAEKLIYVSSDDQGVNQPRLTQKQREDALQATYDAIDATLDKKITEDEPVRSGGGSGGGSSKESKPVSNIANRVYNAVKLSSSNAREAEKQLNEASGGKYIFKYESDGLNVYKIDDRGELVKQNSTPFSGNKYADNLWPYFPVEDKEWANDLNKLRQGGGTLSAKQSSKPKAKSGIKW